MIIYKNPYFGKIIVSDTMPDNFTGVKIADNLYIPAVYIPDEHGKTVKSFKQVKPINYNELSKQELKLWNDIKYMEIEEVEVYSLGNKIASFDTNKQKLDEKCKVALAMILARTVTHTTTKIITIRKLMSTMLDKDKDSKLKNILDTHYNDFLDITGFIAVNNNNTMDYIYSHNVREHHVREHQYYSFNVYRINNITPAKFEYKSTFNGDFLTSYTFYITFLKRKKDDLCKITYKLSYEGLVLKQTGTKETVIFTAEIANNIRKQLIALL